MVSRPKSSIPVGTQFAPTVISFPAFLKALVKHSGDRDALADAVWGKPVRKDGKSNPSRRNRRLPLEAAAQYGLLTKGEWKATPLSKSLLSMKAKERKEAFARHILLKLGGLRVLEACIEMEADGLKLTGDSLSRYLTDHGFPVTEHNTAINSLRLWLAEAGVFPSTGWTVNVSRRDEVLGLTGDRIKALAGLNDDQREFTLAICRLQPSGWVETSTIRKLAETASARTLPRHSGPRAFLDPLKAAGLVEFKTKGQAGGKSSQFRTTKAFKREVLEPFLADTVPTLDPSLASYYATRPKDIYKALGSRSIQKKGEALEAFSVYIMRLLGLRFEAWRKRPTETGRAEVDVLLYGTFGVVPTRWQVQCKNTPSASITAQQVAREVGLVPLTRATHVLVFGTGPVSDAARRYASQINRRTPTSIFLLGKDDFERVKKDPSSLSDALKQEAERIALAKRMGDSSEASD